MRIKLLGVLVALLTAGAAFGFRRLLMQPKSLQDSGNNLTMPPHGLQESANSWPMNSKIVTG